MTKSITIVGSGIIGLSTAIMLRESGHSVKILERNSSFGLGTVFFQFFSSQISQIQMEVYLVLEVLLL
jgi:2-polyprenyl-6-methoxyphenol hydroxylase-like FAD-dependent oxidoreductase